MDHVTPTTAMWRRLYELASRVHTLSPWSWMDENMVFGIQAAQAEEPAFVSVMGMAGEHTAVAVYLGVPALKGFLDLSRGEHPESLEILLEIPQLQLSFEARRELEPEDLEVITALGLSFSGRQAWPLFRSFRPGFYPWLIDAAEAALLIDALEQVLEVAPRVRRDASVLVPGGTNTFVMREATASARAADWSEYAATILLPDGRPVEGTVDPALLRKLRRLPRGGHPLEVVLFASMARIQAERERPRLPYTLLIADSATEQIIGAEVLEVETDFPSLLARVPQHLCRLLAGLQALPAGIRTDSERLMDLLRDMATALDIPLALEPELATVQEAREELQRQVWSGSATEAPEPRSAKGDERTQPPLASITGADEVRPPMPAGGSPQGGHVGRNDPCPCGSGKKYKKCCLAAQKGRGDELTPRILRRRMTEAVEALAAYAHKTYGDDFTDRAWSEFVPMETDLWSLAPDDTPFGGFFFAWLLFLWIPAESDGDVLESRFPSDGTVAAGYLRRAGARGDARTRDVIQAARRAPLSFWQVEEVEPDRGLLIRDMVTDRLCFLHDRSLPDHAQPWDILFLQVVEVDGIAICGADAPYVLPPGQFRRAVEAALEPIRAHLQEVPAEYPALLLEMDLDLVTWYLDWVDELLNPAPPDVRNTDGDRLEWSRSTYRFAPEQRDLLLGRLESMRNIERVPTAPDTAEFVWMSQRRKDGRPQVHKASLTVRDHELITETNSRRRERNLRQRLVKTLGELLTYDGTDFIPLDEEMLEEMLQVADEREAGDGEGVDKGALDLDQLAPEDRDRLEEAVAQQMLGWADSKIPALGGSTPRQMVKTAAGRIEVEKMLNEWENMDGRLSAGTFRFDFNRLRRSLGLPEE